MDTRTITLVLCFLFLGLMAQAQRTEVRLKRVEQAPRPGAIILAESDSLAAWNDTLYWDGTVLWLDSARTITLPYLQDSILSGYADTTYAQQLVVTTSLLQDSILTYTQDNAEIGRDTVRITWGNIQGIPTDIADGDDDTQLTPSQVVGIARDTGFVERLELADTSSVLRTYTDQAEADAKDYADANDDVDDADADPTNELQNWGNLPGIPTDIADGDDDTQLTPSQVVGIARDTGFVERLELADTSSVLRTYTDQAEADAKDYADANDDVDDADADPTNELQNWSNLPGIPTDIADGDDDTQLTPGQVVGIARDTGFVELQELADTATAIRADFPTDTDTQLSPAQVVGIARDTGFVESIIAGYGLKDVGTTNPELELDFSELGDSPTADGDADVVLYLPTGDVGAKTDLQNLLSNTLISSDSSVTITELGANQINLQSTGGSGSNDWDDLINVPAGFSDNIDDVNDADNDPLNELQSWSNLPGIPSGFADGIDDVGASAEGTLYASITGDNDAVVSMTSNTTDSDVQWHFTNASIANTWYMGLDGSDGKAFKWAWNSNDFSSPVLNIETNGNIGVGTITPSEKIHIDGGNIRVSDGTEGLNKIAYDSDGNGTLSWTTPAAIGIEDTQLSNEEVEDIAGSMVSGNTEYGVSATYNDASSVLNFSTAFNTLDAVNATNSALDADVDQFVMRTRFNNTGTVSATDARVPVYDALSNYLEAGTNITFSQNSTTGQLTINASASGGSGDIEAVTAGEGLSGGGTSGSVSLRTAFFELPLVSNVSGTDYFVMRTDRDENSQPNQTDARVDAQTLLLSVFNEGQEIDISSTNAGQTIDFDVDFSEAQPVSTINDDDEIIVSRFAGSNGNAKIDAEDLAHDLSTHTQEFTQAFASNDISYSTFFSTNPNCREWFLTVTNNASSGATDIEVTIPTPSSTHRGKKIYVIGNRNSNGGEVHLTAGTSNIHGLQGAALAEWTTYVVFGPVMLTCMYDPDSSGNYIWMATNTGG